MPRIVTSDSFSLMKKILFALLIFSSSVFARSYRTLQADTTFHNKNCEYNNTCDLKSFRILVKNIKVTGSFGTSYTTETYMSYTTNKVENLQNYGIVQFIMGCQWCSSNNDNASFEVKRNYFGGYALFHHPEFVIDSFDTDPMYSSWIPKKPHHTRHDLYKWNKIKNSFNEKTEKRFYENGIVHPTLYARDSIGTSYFDNESKSARNSSLGFLTCIYKIEDIPEESAPDAMNPKDAIKCLTWKSSHVFDHDNKKFRSLEKISPICKRQVL